MEHDGKTKMIYAVYSTIIYHSGSIAIGAIIITLIKFIRFLIFYPAMFLARLPDSVHSYAKYVRSCGEYLLVATETGCMITTESAFAYQAISGKGFCQSGWEAFLLEVKHLSKYTFAK